MVDVAYRSGSFGPVAFSPAVIRTTYLPAGSVGTAYTPWAPVVASYTRGGGRPRVTNVTSTPPTGSPFHMTRPTTPSFTSVAVADGLASGLVPSLAAHDLARGDRHVLRPLAAGLAQLDPDGLDDLVQSVRPTVHGRHPLGRRHPVADQLLQVGPVASIRRATIRPPWYMR